MSFSFRDKPRLSERIRGKSGDELLNELKEQFDQDRKMFFETAPKWGPGPATGSYSRTGFPFDDDMMSRSRQDIRSHLDDLAARHPEFADHLRCPPWGGEMGSSQNRGQQHKEFDYDDDARSQASGVSSSSSEPHGPDTGAQGPLPHYGLRNTVDLGQKQQEAAQDEKQVRGQRSMSAPPDNRSQHSEQPQRFVSRVEIPMNAAGATFSTASDASGKPPVAPKQQSSQQNPSTPSKQQGNVRHIPIFVEGRDEPILPKNIAPDHVDQAFAPRTVQPEVEHIFSPWQPSQPAHSFARPSQFYPQQTFVQQPTPASPKQQRHVPTRSEHAVPIKVQHTSQSPKTPTKPPKQGDHTVPIKVQHASTSQQPPKSQPTTASHQPAKPPSKPPEPVAKDPISRVKLVQKDVEQLRLQVQQYSGTSRKDKEYIYLDEMLTRNLLKLDDIETEGKENVRQARKEVIKMIQQCISELEAKVPAPEEVQPLDEPMEEVLTEQTEEKLSQVESKSENFECDKMEGPPTDSATVAQEKKQDDVVLSSNSETANQAEVQSNQTESNEEKSKDMVMDEAKKESQEQMLVEETDDKGLAKENAPHMGVSVKQSEVQNIPMECVADKRTEPAEGAEKLTVPVKDTVDINTTGKSGQDKSVVKGAENKPSVDGAGDSKATPMEVEQLEEKSLELENEAERKQCDDSSGIAEQQVQRIKLDPSCDNDVKS